MWGVKVKIKVVRISNSNLWYADQIGKVFTVARRRNLRTTYGFIYRQSYRGGLRFFLEGDVEEIFPKKVRRIRCL